MAAPFLGVLMLQTRFPRLPGDIGHAQTFDFPVRRAVVAHASPQRVVRDDDRTLLAPFLAAAQALVRQGAAAITTSCGFLVRHQQALADALPVPVWTSSLLQVAELQAALPAGRRVGVLTVDARALTAHDLLAAGAAADTPLQGIADGCSLQRTLLEDLPLLDAAAARAQVVAAALQLQRRCPEVAALVLECTNMPPYAAAVRTATGWPVHDIATMLRARWPAAAAAREGGGRFTAT